MSTKTEPPLSGFERYMLAEAHKAGVHKEPEDWPYCAACYAKGDPAMSTLEERWAARQGLISESWTGTSGQTPEEDEMTRQAARHATKVGFTTTLAQIEDWGRALALAAHDDACSVCGEPNLIDAPCVKRRRIEALR